MLSRWLCKHFFNWQAPVQVVLAVDLLRWARSAEARLADLQSLWWRSAGLIPLQQDLGQNSPEVRWQQAMGACVNPVMAAAGMLRQGLAGGLVCL
jgi:hypothetical protein